MANKLAAIAISQFKKKTGAVRNVIEQCGYLKSIGYDCVIISERLSSSLVHEAGAVGVKIMRWPFSGRWRYRWFSGCVNRWVERNKPSIFISHISYPGASSSDVIVVHNSLALYSEKVFPVKPWILDYHSKVIGNGSYRILIANSELMKSDLVRRYGVDPSKIEIFYQGVDTHLFNRENTVEKRRKGCQKFGLNENKKRVGLVTSGDFEKRNVSFFIEFASILRNKLVDDIEFLVAGRSGNLDQYKKMVRDAGLESNFIFQDLVKEVDLVFHSLDLHVFPALLEEFGRAVMEGLACGVPTLCSSNVGAAELMYRHDVPSVINNYDVDVWVEEALKILSDSQISLDCSDKAVKLAFNYSQENQSEEMLAIMNKFI